MHETLASIASEFKSFKLNWATSEKEGYAIFRVFDKPGYLPLGEQDVHVFTDYQICFSCLSCWHLS